MLIKTLFFSIVLGWPVLAIFLVWWFSKPQRYRRYKKYGRFRKLLLGIATFPVWFITDSGW